MSFEILSVKTKNQLKGFVDLPWKIYEKDPNWAPPLKMSIYEILSPKHPFYKHAEIKKWIALKNGEIVGRVAAIVDRNYNLFHKEQMGFFGFFECIENQDIAKSLLQEAQKFLISKNCKIMRGPMNPSTNYECGLLVEGYDETAVYMMAYNPNYYENCFENFGLKKSQDLLAYDFDLEKELPRKIMIANEYANRSKRITWRHLNKKKWDQEVNLMLEIYNNAWEKNWGFVPMSEAEFRHTAKDMKAIIDERLIMFVEVAGEPAGFIVVIPDLNQVLINNPSGKLFPTGALKILFGQKKIDHVRVITMGVKEKYRNLGIGGLMYVKMKEVLNNTNQYKRCEMSWILESNTDMNRPLVAMGAEPYRRYRVYDKQIS